ncbi:uridine diphosphate-N-acetylglucosamine-binding protein YvcK [Arcanobacterium haemolyticum]|nr:uridine diphosphate-N-acetylglucosamine-binding protein YvcK [Arcanobacterium haemolyticum]
MASRTTPPQVVALGGGHGLYASLSALKHLTDDVTAIVTVADDGGSSGRLRKEFGVLPPGDIRMALSALCDNSEWGRTWRDVLQHRFSSDGPLDGHALGNLLIVALWEKLEGSVPALDWVGELLQIHGRVLPMSTVPLEIEADITHADGESETIRGQVAVALTQGHVEQVRLVPSDPPIVPEVREAVSEADWTILGPGSWYTSVIPHLMVPDLKHALCSTPASRMLVLNLLAEKETRGMSAAEHIASIHSHAPDLRLDVILADPSSIDDVASASRAAAATGARLVLRDVRMRDGSPRHDPLLLAAAFRDVFESGE